MKTFKRATFFILILTMMMTAAFADVGGGGNGQLLVYPDDSLDTDPVPYATEVSFSSFFALDFYQLPYIDEKRDKREVFNKPYAQYAEIWLEEVIKPVSIQLYKDLVNAAENTTFYYMDHYIKWDHDPSEYDNQENWMKIDSKIYLKAAYFKDEIFISIPVMERIGSRGDIFSKDLNQGSVLIHELIHAAYPNRGGKRTGFLNKMLFDVLLYDYDKVTFLTIMALKGEHYWQAEDFNTKMAVLKKIKNKSYLTGVYESYYTYFQQIEESDDLVETIKSFKVDQRSNVIRNYVTKFKGRRSDELADFAILWTMEEKGLGISYGSLYAHGVISHPVYEKLYNKKVVERYNLYMGWLANDSYQKLSSLDSLRTMKDNGGCWALYTGSVERFMKSASYLNGRFVKRDLSYNDQWYGAFLKIEQGRYCDYLQQRFDSEWDKAKRKFAFRRHGDLLGIYVNDSGFIYTNPNPNDDTTVMLFENDEFMLLGCESDDCGSLKIQKEWYRILNVRESYNEKIIKVKIIKSDDPSRVGEKVKLTYNNDWKWKVIAR